MFSIGHFAFFSQRMAQEEHPSWAQAGPYWITVEGLYWRPALLLVDL
jgi:hypothetical protein